MSIYFLLIGVVLLIPLACTGIKSKEARDRRILFLSMLAIFLLMALKAPTVGRDTIGYRNLYRMMEFRSWRDYDISWMEWGYELLTMIFVHVFHASFQTFMACVYAFVYFSYYRFFRRYSQNYTTSVLLYICFTFLSFDTSAIRTTLGIAICLFAVPFAEKKGIKNTIIFFAITLLAAQIHTSAYIFFAIYFIIRIKFSKRSALFYIGIPVILLLFRRRLYLLINMYFRTVQVVGSAFGGNMIIYILCLALTGAVWYYYDRETNIIIPSLINQPEGEDIVSNDSMNEIVNYLNSSGLAMRMIYAGIIMQLFAANSVLARMAQYMQFFVLILVPNNIARLNVRSRILVKVAVYFFAILYFWYFSLRANALDIVPYKFFWNLT